MPCKVNQSNTGGLECEITNDLHGTYITVTEDFNEWLSRHFDRTYDEMMLVLTE